MIRKYTFGNPMETDAVVHKIEKETGEVPFMGVGADQLAFTYKMDDNTRIYGLGENVMGINKRGWRYISNCSDDPNHREEKNSLYAAHNFIIIEGKERFGLFFDYPGMLTFDLGYTSSNDLSIIPA